MVDELSSSRRIRSLNVVDNFCRESLAFTGHYRLGGKDIVATMEYLKMSRGIPRRIQVDNGS